MTAGADRTAIKFIPFPLILGLTSGIAVLIFSRRFKDLLGLSMGAVHTNFVAAKSALYREP